MRLVRGAERVCAVEGDAGGEQWARKEDVVMRMDD